MRIIHFEDSADKHMDICRQLRGFGEGNVVWVTNIEDGIEEIKNAMASGAPFDLAITDMHFPKKRGLRPEEDAGRELLKMLGEMKLDLPVIICSSLNYRLPGIYGSVWYSELSDWEWELRDLVKQRKKELQACIAQSCT